MKPEQYKKIAKAIAAGDEVDLNTTVVSALREAAKERVELEAYRRKFGELHRHSVIMITCRKTGPDCMRIHAGMIEDPTAPCSTNNALRAINDRLQENIDNLHKEYIIEKGTK